MRTLWTVEIVVSECDSSFDVLEAHSLPKLKDTFCIAMAKGIIFLHIYLNVTLHNICRFPPTSTL